jgi:hypothetical protein
VGCDRPLGGIPARPWSASRSPRVIDALLPFASHPSADVRYAAVHGLMPHETPTFVEAMANLSRDSALATLDARLAMIVHWIPTLASKDVHLRPNFSAHVRCPASVSAN